MTTDDSMELLLPTLEALLYSNGKYWLLPDACGGSFPSSSSISHVALLPFMSSDPSDKKCSLSFLIEGGSAYPMVFKRPQNKSIFIRMASGKSSLQCSMECARGRLLSHCACVCFDFRDRENGCQLVGSSDRDRH